MRIACTCTDTCTYCMHNNQKRLFIQGEPLCSPLQLHLLSASIQPAQSLKQTPRKRSPRVRPQSQTCYLSTVILVEREPLKPSLSLASHSNYGERILLLYDLHVPRVPLSPLYSPLLQLQQVRYHQDIIESAATVALSDLHLQLFAYHPLLVLFLIFSFLSSFSFTLTIQLSLASIILGCS